MARRGRRRRYVFPNTDLTPIKRTVARNYGFFGDPDEVKYHIAQQLNIPLTPGYNGELPSREAGRVGGNIGGPMVREMIRFAEEQLAQTVTPAPANPEQP